MAFVARISPYAAKYLRRRGEDLLTDTCRITRARVTTLDPVTNEFSHDAGPVIYEGACRLWQNSSGMSVQVGDENMAVSTVYLSLPWDIDPIPEMEDLVEILTAQDPAVVGTTLFLGSPTRGGNLRGTRRYLVKTESSTKDTW